MDTCRGPFGKSIDKTAGTLETARQLLGILIDTALKEHVFDRMKKASVLRLFISRTVGLEP